MRKKYIDIAKSLEARVQGGDYALASLPGERRIAEEFGVSHMTARRAVKHLLDSGILSRPAGRLKTAGPKRPAKRQIRICCILPAFYSAGFHQWFHGLSKVVAERRGIARAVVYVHEEDPVIQQAILGDFTGFFLLPPHQPSQLLLDHMVRNKHRLVTLWQDYTELGIPCLEAGPVAGVDRLVEHLAALGHKRIDCLNTQPDDSVVRNRIIAWRAALDRLGLDGNLYDLPVEPFDDSALSARDHARRLIETRRLTSTAMFCVTTAAAIGVCRAMRELNIEVGKRYSVCGFGEMTAARLYSPSITVAEPGDILPYLRKGLDWVLAGGKDFEGSLLFQPDQSHVWIGESTGPVSQPLA